jgi:hypothetical protein
VLAFSLFPYRVADRATYLGAPMSFGFGSRAKPLDVSGPDEGLLMMLREIGLDEDVIDAVTHPNGSPYKWKTTTEFFWSINKLDPQASIERIIQTVPCLQGDGADRAPMQACKMAAAYDLARRTYDEDALARSDVADDEKPLHERVVARLDSEFKKVYSFNPLGWLRPGDKTKAKVFKWLQPAGHKEVFPMECMKCHEKPVKPEEKQSQDLGNGFQVVARTGQEKAEKITSPWEYQNRMKTWAYAMAWAGTEKKSGAWGEVRDCPLDIFINYAEEAYRRCIKTPEPLRWIRERDEKTRAKMIEYMKDPDYALPAGKALTRAVEDLHGLWDIEKATARAPTEAVAHTAGYDHSALMQAISYLKGSGKGAARPAPRKAASFMEKLLKKQKKQKGGKGGKGARAKAGGKGKGRGTKSWTPVTIPGNQNICPAFNLGRCDHTGASCDKGLHVCNRFTRNGKHCGCSKGMSKCRG